MRRRPDDEAEREQPLWVLLDETPHDDWDGLSFIGLFTSRQAAFQYLRKEVLDPEQRMTRRAVGLSRQLWEGSLTEGRNQVKVFLCFRPEVLA